MNCTNCRVHKIGPETKPFGGFLCSNEHLQCYECNGQRMGVCLSCGAFTKFVQMKFDSPKPLEPQLSTLSKQMSDEIETQSRLSKEVLSMNCSGESIESNLHPTHGEDAPAENPTSFIGGLEDHNVSKCLSTEDLSQAKAFEGNRNIEYKNIFQNPLDVTGLRFMDSTESSNNFTLDSEDFERTTSCCYKSDELKCLSTKVLQDFDSQNSGSKDEVVDKYLKTCHSSFYTSPAYNCKNSNWHSDIEPRKQKSELEMKSVSISTESEPSLKSACKQTPEKSVGKLSPQEYFVMQAAEVVPTTHVLNFISDKSQNVPIIDIRMQKVFQTLKEDIRINGFADKSYLTKPPTPTPPKKQEEKLTVRNNCHKEDRNSDLMNQLTNIFRAHYNPTLSYPPPEKSLQILPESHSSQLEPPPPQFKRVPCSNVVVQEIFHKQTDFPNSNTVPANLLHIPRAPILCPESTCQRMIFVSDFNKHLVVDHSHLPMERISPFQCKNFFLDPHLFMNGISKCHLLYLMCAKDVTLGSTEYKDFLPLLVMTSRISLSQICDLREQESSVPDYFLIWITGIVPEGLPISVSLTAWSRADVAPSCHIVHSGQMYSIRNSQYALDIWQSGSALLLSSQEIATLTSYGTEMLNLQLCAH